METDALIDRPTAKSNGLKRYFNGKACANGHVAERLTSTGKCVVCHRLRRVRQYWKNPDQSRKKKRNYDARNVDENRLRSRLRYAANPSRPIEASREWRRRNPEIVRKHNSDYYSKNIERERVRSRAKAARRRGADGNYTRDDVTRITKMQKGRCSMCRARLTSSSHIDHITPISRGGPNYPRNIQILCQLCNQQKHAKDPIQFAQERGLLL